MKRLASNLVFWLLMIPISVGSLVFVVVAYLPFVALKAAYLGLTGQLEKTTGRPATRDSAPPVHPG